MGKIVTIEYVDDLEGTSIDARSVDTVEFSYRGKDYSLVLTKKNGAKFDKDIERYITAAKKAQTRQVQAPRTPAKTSAKDVKPTAAARRKSSPRKRRGKAVAGSERTRAIRQWAADNGHTVSARGRISTEILKAYDAAQ